MAWTDEQQLVINQRNQNILVAAAAGSGKTAVLVERIITLITEGDAPLDIDHILVLTFTKSAAAEMKDRIRRAIEKKLEAEPDNNHLLKQATLIHKAKICTIDSFCSYIVKNYFYTIGVEPGFRIASSQELKNMQDSVLDDIIEAHLESDDSAFKDLLNAYSKGTKVSEFKDVIKKLWDKAAGYPWPKEWMAKTESLYTATDADELNNMPWMEEIMERAAAYISEAIALIDQAIEAANEPGGPDKEIAILLAEKDMYESILENREYGAMRDVIKTLHWDTLRFGKTNSSGETIDETIKERVKALRNAAKDIMKDGSVSKLLYDTVDSTLEKMPVLLSTVQQLIAITLEYEAALSAKKREDNVYDFNDVEHMALNILRDENTHEITEVAKELAQGYYQVMVDEYQDSNHLQEEILTAVCHDDNYFMVGDIKQSIYSFRRATPKLFARKYDAFPPDEKAIGARNRRIDLNKNFRSRSEVLDFANDICRQLMKADIGGVNYDDRAKLYRGSEDFTEKRPECNAEIIVINSSKDALRESQIPVKEQLEAMAVAERISELMKGFKVYDGNLSSTDKMRPIRYHDIAILMRSPSAISGLYAATLRQMGIPAYVDAEGGFFAANEIMYLLSYLHVIDNADDDINLAAVLHSPMYGLGNDDLAMIRYEYSKSTHRRKGEPFYDAVFKYSTPCDGHRRFIEDLLELRKRAGFEPVHTLLERIVALTDYENKMHIIPGGKARIANIDRLIDMAVEFESSGDMSVSGFMRYIDDMVTYEQDPGVAASESENADVVRIMSIHKSKGLEFPVVFVSNMGHGFNDSDLRDNIIIHDQYGVGIKYRNPIKKERSNTLIFKAIEAGVKESSRGEEMRMLYVALTRAKEKLILTGCVDGGEEGFTALSKGVDGADISRDNRKNAKSYIAWVAQAVKACENSNLTESEHSILYITPKDIATAYAINELEKDTIVNWLDIVKQHDGDDRIASNISYAYPYRIDNEYKTKYSVSELKHEAIEEIEEDNPSGHRLFEHPEDDEYIPEFARDISTEKVSSDVPAGAIYGTAVHRFFEVYDFARDDFATSISEQFENMKSRHLLTDDQIKLIRPERFAGFMSSPIAERMHIAQKNNRLYREQPFVFAATPSQLGVDESDNENHILVQGEIDVFFEENDKLVLLDYKTDRVDTSDELVLRYKRQLYLYRDAIMKAYNRPVDEVLIYSMRLGETIDVR